MFRSVIYKCQTEELDMYKNKKSDSFESDFFISFILNLTVKFWLPPHLHLHRCR